MEKQAATKIVKDTFNNPFDKGQYLYFIKNLFNFIDESKNFMYKGQYIPDAFKPYIHTLERIGKYVDAEGEKIDILITHLRKETSLERARTMQRNFIAWYLDGSRGGDLKDAAIVAFHADDLEDWRFSLVKMEYKLSQTSGKVKAKKELTPARRYSFLVGENEPNHTAQQQLVPLLQDDINNPNLIDIEEAFNIEKVTREFFAKYRELFLWTKEELDKIVRNDTKVRADFESKGVDTVNFAKKLMGQIVFLYFLQKKGWFGVARDANWGSGSKQFLRELFEGKQIKYANFFNDVLESLFYDALALDRSHIGHWNDHFKCKIPFLNGGLFDPMNNYDWPNTDILLPNKLFSNKRRTNQGDIGDGILDVFDRYNFTVKEDEPLDKEVAIDPELLGRVYEKFNAIRPDNYDEYIKSLESGKKGAEIKFNKQYGVYYTPREIVHYMCQQSLINYLYTELNQGCVGFEKIGDPQFDAFGSKSKKGQQNLTIEHRSTPIIPKNDIEILIKQGEYVSENEARVLNAGRETDTYYYKLPESIRKNAKLIDNKLEEIMVCDPAVGSGAFPVGMMSEVVKARNVLSAFLNGKKRKIYDFKRQCIEHSLYGVDIDPGAVEIAKLRLWLSLVVDEDDIENIKPLPNLDYKIVCGNSLLGVKKDLFNANLFSELEKLKPLFFNETNPTKKQNYKKQIDKLISEITSGHTEFDFEVYFSEVFHQKSGFDVVIANPPYVQIKQIPWDERKIYKKRFKYAVGRFNLFYFFLEIASMIVKQNGFSTFIVPDRLLLNTQCDKLRKWLLQEQTILEIDSFAEGVFQTVVDNIIIIYRNVQSCGEHVESKNRISVGNLERAVASKIPVSYFLNSPSNQFDLAYNPEIALIIDKMKSLSSNLGSISDVKDGIIQGMVADKLFLEKPLDVDSKPLLFGKDVTKYSIRFNSNWVNYKPTEMMRLEVKRRGSGVRHGLWMRNPEIFERNKILTRQTADAIIAAYDAENYYYSNTLHGTTVTDKDYHPFYVLALLNSRLMTWYYRSTTAEEGKVFAQIKIDLLRLLPIKKASNTEQQLFINIVDRIHAITKDEDYMDNSVKQTQVTELECKIDRLIYKLYNLTDDEIRIVEGLDR